MLLSSPLSLSATSNASVIEQSYSASLANPLEPVPSPSPRPPTSPSNFAKQPGKSLPKEKDLTFLLDPSIFHPLSQLDIPLPLRQHLPPPPTAETPLQDSLSQLDTLLSRGEFLSVASFAASILVSGSVSPMDSKTIFELLELRYSCLELTGNVVLAAQEAKALEDLNSSFYYNDHPPQLGELEASRAERPLQQHIIPFSLRLQALRLQAMGFSDPRRGISALYDLGLECRTYATSQLATSEERDLWSGRLSEIGIKVVNALIEMEDLDCAARTLATIQPTDSKTASTWKMRMVLLYLKMGDLFGAQRFMEGLDVTDAQSRLLPPLLVLAEGRYEDAALAWEQALEIELPKEEGALIKQNLAVAYLYSGQIERTGEIMEGLVDKGNSFQSLILNLATLYELSSDRSRDLKIALAGRVAKQAADSERGWTKTNADFKL